MKAAGLYFTEFRLDEEQNMITPNTMVPAAAGQCVTVTWLTVIVASFLSSVATFQSK